MQQGEPVDSLHYPLTYTALPARSVWWRIAPPVIAALTILIALSISAPPALRITLILFGGAIAAFPRLLSRRDGEPCGEVRIDGHGIMRIEAKKSVRLARWGGPFGVTIFSNRACTRLLFAFTTPDSTRYLNVPILRRDTDTLRDLLANAIVLTDSDVCWSHQDSSATIDARDALDLYRVLMTRAPASFERVYMSTPQGAIVLLNGGILRVGTQMFDLTAPLEWQGLVFKDSGGGASLVYQGTRVRQAGTEVVLVSLLPDAAAWLRPNEAAWHEFIRESGRTSEQPESSTRVNDVRLMKSVPVDPPPPEIRFAIDRLFVLPFRQALDRAPSVH